MADSLNDVARALSISPATLRRWVAEGIVPLRDGKWTPAALAQARIVARMRARGHDLEQLRAAGVGVSMSEVLDAADALLFDEPDAPAKRAAGHQVLAALVDNERWQADPAAEVRAALDGCRAHEPVTRSRWRARRAR